MSRRSQKYAGLAAGGLVENLESRLCLSSIEGIAFIDANQNLVLDEGETPVADIQVFCWEYISGSTLSFGGLKHYSADTTASGHFEIDGVERNEYFLDADRRGINGSTDHFLIGDDDHITLNLPLDQSSYIAGTVLIDKNKNMKVDANDQPADGAKVFIDKDNDGVRDENEGLYTTSSDGEYYFTGCTGNYKIRVDYKYQGHTFSIVNKIKSGVAASSTDINYNPILVGTLGKVKGKVFIDKNWDNKINGKDKILSGVYVFTDLNGNGKLDDSEPKCLTDDKGVFKLSAFSDKTGVLKVANKNGKVFSNFEMPFSWSYSDSSLSIRFRKLA